MRQLFIWIAVTVLLAGFSVPSRGIDVPLKAYFTGEMKGLNAFYRDLDLSDYKLVTGLDGSDKVIEKLNTKHGKALLVVFWMRACLPCTKYLKELDAVQKALGDDRFEVIAVDLEGHSLAMTARELARLGLTSLAPYGDFHPSIVQELDANPGFRFHGREPKTLLVDRSGKVRAYSNVMRDWLSDDGKALIEALKDGKL